MSPSQNCLNQLKRRWFYFVKALILAKYPNFSDNAIASVQKLIIFLPPKKYSQAQNCALLVYISLLTCFNSIVWKLFELFSLSSSLFFVLHIFSQFMRLHCLARDTNFQHYIKHVISIVCRFLFDLKSPYQYPRDLIYTGNFNGVCRLLRNKVQFSLYAEYSLSKFYCDEGSFVIAVVVCYAKNAL